MEAPPKRVRLCSAAALLFAINAIVCRPLFRAEYTLQWASIEGAYIGISRYIMGHGSNLNWSNLTWFPLWYDGVPFQNAYPPLLPMLVAVDAWLFRISPARAHHIVTAGFYCLGPVALFLLVYALSGRMNLSLATALVFSFTSPSALLLHGVSRDMESIRGARRLQTLIAYGDGPHISAIALLLFAVLALHLAIEKGSPMWTCAAILAFASVALTNWLGSFALAMASFSYILARSSSDRRSLRTLGIFAGVAIIAFCLAVPWIPPSTIGDIQRNARSIEGVYPMGARQLACWAAVLLSCGALWRLLASRGVTLCVQFGAYFLFLTAALTLLADRFDFYLMPQPQRYHLELEIAAAIVVVFGLGPILLRRLGARRIWLTAALAAAGMMQVIGYSGYVQSAARPADVHQAIEYRVGTWLERNLPGQRIFAAGSVQYWLDAFAANPQVGGGFGQGVVNPEIPIIQYGIPFTKGDGERTAMWLRLAGAKAVVVSGPAGRDVYKDVWRDPGKFQGVLPELWRDGADAIYGVPQRSASLAHAILPADVVARAPANVTDVEPVAGLAASLEDPSLPLAEFTWLRPGEARISSFLRPEMLLFVAVNYHPGWAARVDGQSRRIRRDGLGFLVIEPKCNGPCEVDLLFDGGAEMHWAKAARILGIAAALAWMWLWVASGVTISKTPAPSH
jgi:hypothetical protein